MNKRGVNRPGGLELTRRMLDISGVSPGARLLDVGCGEGATVQDLLILGYDAVGVDVEIMANAHGDTHLARGSAYALQWSDSCFDGIFCECVFSLLNRPGAALGEFKRVLKPGGKLIMSDLYSRANGGKIEGISKNLYTRADICNLLNNCGFEPECFEDHSDAMKTMLAQLIMDIGDKNIYEEIGVDYEQMKCLKCGYYSLIAKLKK